MNNHPLVVLDAGAEVLPDYNVPVAAVLSGVLSGGFQIPSPVLTRLTFSLSRLSIWVAASSGFLSLIVTSRVEKTLRDFNLFLLYISTAPSTPLKPYEPLTGQRANIHNFSHLMMQHILRSGEGGGIFLPELHL